MNFANSSITFPFSLGAGQSTKPNKNDPNYTDDKSLYYLDYAKYALYSARSAEHVDWVNRTDLNTRFYQNDQWSVREDIETFLMDSTGQTRNRIKVKINQIRPMVELFRGNAQRMTIDAYAKSISKNVQTRKEKALEKVLFTQKISAEFPDLGNIIKSENPEIEDTVEDTELNFNQGYVDEYVTNMNRLIEFVKELNDMNEMQTRVAENLAFSGLGIIEEFKQGEHLRKEPVDPTEFFWDRNAKRPDLQDASFMGRLLLMTAPDILERWQNISELGKEAIKSSASNTDANQYYSMNNSLPVYKIFFQDQESKYVGYVKDEYDQDYMVYLNQKDDLSDGKVWTEEDLIDPPETRSNKKLFKGKKKRKVVVSVIKYCFYIPGEAVSSDTSNPQSKTNDILLEWGPYEYQETTWLDLSVAKYPFKCYCWSYIKGVVSSPIDDIINPQRLINRIMSGLESQINNAGGAGIIYDKDMVETEDEELELLRNANAGNAIGIRTRGKGVPNTIGNYDNTVKNGTYQMFQLIPILEGLIKNMTGVNEALRGESTGSDQLVGVTEMLMQRGSLMQEPFYNALARVFIQSHQSTAIVGKQIYMENQRELVNILGEQGVKVFQLSEDMANEDFRTFITRSESKEAQIQSGDRNLLILLESGLIDQNDFADMFGRSTVEQVNSKLREISNKKVIEAKKAAEEQAKAQQQLAQQQEQQLAKQQQQVQQDQTQQQVFETARDNDKHAREMEKMIVEKEIDQSQNV